MIMKMNTRLLPPSPNVVEHWLLVVPKAKIASRNAWCKRATIRCWRNRKIVKITAQLLEKFHLIRKLVTEDHRSCIRWPKRSHFRREGIRNHQKCNTRNQSSSLPSIPKYTPITKKNPRRKSSRASRTR